MEQSTLGGDTATLPPEIARNISFHYYESQPDVQYMNPIRETIVSEMMEVIEESENEKVDESVAFDLFDKVEENLDTCSLWMVVENPKQRTAKEFPVYVQSPFGSVLSKDREYSSTDGKELSDNFFRCVSDVVDNSIPEPVQEDVDKDTGWGIVHPDAYADLSSPEKKFVDIVHRQITGGFPSREIAMLVQYSQTQYGPNTAED